VGDCKWVEEVHPLFDDTEEGYRMRRRVVDGPREGEEDSEVRKAHNRWMEELKGTIPERYRWVLDLYKRK